MQRVIIHWSEGRNLSNDTDRAHYHLLIEQDAKGVVKVTRGDHSIADNASTSDGIYAAHTRNCNTGSIGVALCGMMGCEEKPFSSGPAPITKAQWDTMVQVIAVLCQRYDIPLTARTVLCHGEVQRNLGITQKGKWDPMRWPWAPEVPGSKIGDLLRQAVRDAIMGGAVQTAPVVEPPVIRSVTLPSGKVFTTPVVRVEDGDTLIALRPACEAEGITIVSATGWAAILDLPGQPTINLDTEGDTGFVSVRELAPLLGAKVGWEPKTRMVTLAKKDKEL